MEPGTTIKERLGDTVVFRSYNIALLIQIRDRLDQMIELLEEIAKPVEFTLSEEEFDGIRQEFGTTD